MALIKKYMTSYGVEVSYWRVDVVTVDKRAKEASFILGAYISKDAEVPIVTKTITSLLGMKDKSVFNKYFIEDNGYTNIYQSCYEYIKDNDSFFSDCEDDSDYIDNVAKEEIKTLEDMKSAKISEVKENKQDIIAYGVDIPLSNGDVEHFTLSDSDQISLMGLQGLVIAGQENIPWHTSDAEQHCKFYSNADMQTITSTALTYVTYQTTYCRDLCIYINSLENVEDVEKVVYGMNIPEEYQSDVLKAMISNQSQQSTEDESNVEE